ncbi:hypothetical protein LINGRAHAP2_LOCUS30456 [Linum grandiflorum]
MFWVDGDRSNRNWFSPVRFDHQLLELPYLTFCVHTFSNVTSIPELMDLTILPLEVCTSCKEVNGLYLIRLTTKRRTVRTYS